MKKKFFSILICDILGSLFLGISITVFAVAANFAPGGVTGLAVIINFLFNIPIGFAIILINVPIIFFTYKRLGKYFFIMSLKSIIISSFFLDYIICYFPVFNGDNIIAAFCSGIFAGIGYSLFFNEGSSTGGTDFIIVSIKKYKPELSFGFLAFFIDIIVVVLFTIIFRNLQAFVYGLIYTFTTSIFMNITTKLITKTFNVNQN